jgi:hydrogenase maturation factor
VEGALPLGKLPGELLARLLARYATPDERLLVAPGVGRDAAAIALDDARALVVKSDPITFATAEIGWYLVNVNANDLACMGATPRWLLVTALFPEGATTPALVEETFAGLHDAATALGIQLVGGHCEITVGLERLILVGQLLGDAAPDELLDLRRSRPGDVLLLCGGIAIEGAALLAREAADKLTGLPPALLARARDFLRDPGLSVVPAAMALRDAGVTVRGMHDPTEGGLATALAEVAAASGLGLDVARDDVLIYDECEAICAALGLDPLGLIASGALLAVVAPADAQRACAAVRAREIPCAAIGTLLPAEEGVWLSRHGQRATLPSFAVDEIARYFAESNAS